MKQNEAVTFTSQNIKSQISGQFHDNQKLFCNYLLNLDFINFFCKSNQLAFTSETQQIVCKNIFCSKKKNKCLFCFCK